MQAVGGLVLNAIGLWTDDYVVGQSPVTPQLLAKVGWNAGVDKNDVPLRTSFPYVALPHRGSDGLKRTAKAKDAPNSIGIRVPDNHFIGSNYPNPVATSTSMAFHLATSGDVTVTIYDAQGQLVETVMSEYRFAGDHDLNWTPNNGIAAGSYFAKLTVNGQPSGTTKITLTR